MGTHTLDRDQVCMDQRRARCVGCAASALWVATALRLASAAAIATATAIVSGLVDDDAERL